MTQSAKAAIAARKKSRRLIVQALYQSQHSDQSNHELMAQFLAFHDFGKADTDYFKEVVGGVLSEQDELDTLIDQCSKIPIHQIDPVERGVLWLSFYELKHRMDIPYPVVINEAIQLAKTFGADQSHRFINATLDKSLAELRALELTAKRHRE
ncbi:MAG: transcription antitermination factor NusB [Pseudomonadota bacterium]|nr:transcription antitermination factor NusB [Pseudomonadota bacterium]